MKGNRLRLTLQDKWRLIAPYAWRKILEQVKAVAHSGVGRLDETRRILLGIFMATTSRFRSGAIW